MPLVVLSHWNENNPVPPLSCYPGIPSSDTPSSRSSLPFLVLKPRMSLPTLDCVSRDREA
eukprot:871754-Rhodomonas_salina.1